MKNIGWLKNNKIAHRGLYNNKSNAPENSLNAFKLAIDKGYAIEFDIHFTHDRKIVVFHDSTLKRMCKIDIAISQASYSELCKYTLLNSNCKIPLLSDVLIQIGGKVPLLIEIKCFRNIHRNMEILLKALEKYNGNYALQSFNPFVIRWLSIYVPYILKGLIVYNIILYPNFMRNFFFSFCGSPDFFSICKTALPNSTIRYFRQRGILILSWTIKNQREFENVVKECDCIIFEQ